MEPPTVVYVRGLSPVNLLWLFNLVVFIIILNEGHNFDKDERRFMTFLIVFNVCTLLNGVPFLQLIPFGFGVYLLTQQKEYATIRQRLGPAMKICFAIAIIISLLYFVFCTILIVFWAVALFFLETIAKKITKTVKNSRILKKARGKFGGKNKK